MSENEKVQDPVTAQSVIQAATKADGGSELLTSSTTRNKLKKQSRLLRVSIKGKYGRR